MSAIEITLYKMYDCYSFLIGMPQVLEQDDALRNNTYLFLKTDLNCKDCFNEYWTKETNKFVKMLEHQSYPLANLLTTQEIDKNVNVFIMMEELIQAQQKDDILMLPQNDITFIASIHDESLALEIVNQGFIKDAQDIGIVLKHLIINCLRNMECSIENLELVSQEEKQILLNLNNTSTTYPKEKSIGMLLEEQVKLTPNNIALSFHLQNITYKTFNERVNQLVAFLIQKGAGQNQVVAILLERSFEMYISIFAILKAGAAYLPIDSDYPEERINFMLEDSKVQILISDGVKGKKYENNYCVITPNDSDIDKQDKGNPEINISGGQLAYIMYTSGSTGNPKGTLINHNSIIRVIKNTNFVEIYQSDVIPQLSSYVFDGSVFDIYGALLNGAKLVIAEKNIIMDIHRLGEFFVQEKISLCYITTALFNLVVEYHCDSFKAVRKILIGGEEASKCHLLKAVEVLGPNRVINGYGPTESTFFATYFSINSKTDAENAFIGKPLSNTQVYILDKKMRLLPVGVPGELYIGGDGLARGYLNQEKLTLERFVASPFNVNERLYKTSDLVKYSESGDIEFISRIDNQIKIRGFRVEMGEIETIINKISGIKESIVVLSEVDDIKFLVAYYTGTSPYSLKEFHNYLKEKLPAYMIPYDFIQLEEFPLNINGKIDRKLLALKSFIDSCKRKN